MFWWAGGSLPTTIWGRCEGYLPRPNQFCLDDLDFVLRVSFNRGGDAVFARYILGHFPCPPRKAL